MKTKILLLTLLTAVSGVIHSLIAAEVVPSASPIPASYNVVWDTLVTRFDAGAQVPGVTARYLKCQLHPPGEFPLVLKQVQAFGRKP